MKALHRALNFGIDCKCGPPHEVTVELNWAACESDLKRMVQIAMPYQDGPAHGQSPSCWRKFQVISKAVAPTGLTGQLLAPPGELPRSPSPTSFIRSKLTRINLFTSSSDSSICTPTTSCRIVSDKVLTTSVVTPALSEIRGLCAQVRRQCDAWTLTGLLRDPDSKSETPHIFLLNHIVDGTEVPRVAKPLELKSLIASQQLEGKSQSRLALSAQQRYGIAAALCWSVLHLSGSPWLREQWRRKQAKILIEKTDAGRDVLSRHPCISCLLPSAMESPPQQITTTKNTTTADFSHLIPNKLIFELGILLIELCINKPLSGLKLSSNLGPSPDSAAPLEDYSTAVSMLDEVRSLIGNGYGDAVELCVKFVFRGGIGSTKEFEHPDFRREFYETVVAPVQATYLIMLGL